MRATCIRTILTAIFAIASFSAGTSSYAGPNNNAGCRIDMDVRTQEYGNGMSEQDIETAGTGKEGDILTVAVVAQNVSDLDTYQVEVHFDPQALEYVQSPADFPAGVSREPSGLAEGQWMGYEAVNRPEGILNISKALVGKDPEQAPDGTFVIAFVQFKVLRKAPAELSLENVFFVDSYESLGTVAALGGGRVN